MFTKQANNLLDDKSYRNLQNLLIKNPKAGDVIRGTGGLRKIRVATSGHGKKGGSRIIYYHFDITGQIALLMIYPKNKKDDLTDKERKFFAFYNCQLE